MGLGVWLFRAGLEKLRRAMVCGVDGWGKCILCDDEIRGWAGGIDNGLCDGLHMCSGTKGLIGAEGENTARTNTIDHARKA